MKRAFLFVLVALALLYVVREFEYAGIRRNKKGEFAKLETAFEKKNNFDILVIGSSRAEYQFYTPYLDSATGLTSYNIGLTGATMPLICSSLEAYLVHSKAPRYVILNLDLHSFSDNPDTIYSFPRYFPYLDNEKLFQGLVAREKRFTYFRYLAFYSMPYYGTRYFNCSIRGWIGKEGKYDKDYELGFTPNGDNKSMGDFDTINLPYTRRIPQPVIVKSLRQITEICKTNHCKLILAVVPVYHRWMEHVVNYGEVDDEFHSFADKNGLPYLDFSSDSIRFNKQLYGDPTHLNKQGAILFTHRFSLALAQYIKS